MDNDESSMNNSHDQGLASAKKEDIVRKAKETLNAASRLIRRKVPRSGHFMTSKKFWMQSVPNQDVDVVVTFPPEAGEATVLWFKERIERIPGIQIQTKNLTLSVKGKTKSSCFVFQIRATYQGYLRGLELMQVPKALRDDLGGGLKEFTIKDASHFRDIEDMSLFLSSQERQSIILYLLESVRAENGDTVGNIKFREGEAIIPRSQSSRVILQVFPLHETEPLDELKKKWVYKAFDRQPLTEISNYFGIKIAFYFAWLGHYTMALVIPAAVGAFFWYFLCGRAEFLEDVAFVLFSFFNVIWATLYLESWKRRSAELAYAWGTADQRDELLTEPRPLFKGEECISEITGKPELYYPEWKRNLFRYFVSVPVIALCLMVVFVVVFLILELQQWWDGFIDDHKLFSFLSLLPKILLGIVIPALDGVYNDIALWLNEKENYRNATRFENSLVVKKTVFQFVNSFLALFYTAFYLQDMDKLKELLATLLITRQVIGNVKETLIPYMKKYFKMAKLSFDLFGAVSPSDIQDNKKKNDSVDNQDEDHPDNGGDFPDFPSVSQVQMEATFIQYDGTFDDFLEMLIQFGYVTLFSSAYPLAGFWALLNNIIEIRGDAFKLCHVHQRPFGQRVRNIGSWQTAMEAMGVIGCLVNCALIGLSGQVDRMFPNISSNQTLILIVLLEHVMLLLRTVIGYAIPDVPNWVAKEMAKIEYRRREIERDSLAAALFSVQSESVSSSASVANYNSSQDLADESVQTGGSLSPASSDDTFKPALSERCVDVVTQTQDPEAEEFIAAVSSSSSDVFQKMSYSPFRSTSLKIAADTTLSDSNSESVRKRSCPVETIPEGKAADKGAGKVKGDEHARIAATAMAAVISAHDKKQAQEAKTSSTSNGSAKNRVPVVTLEDFDQIPEMKPKRKKMLKQRMASDTDLWLSIRQHQERYSRMANIASAANESAKTNKEKIIINKVEMPPHVPTEKVSGSGAPTPVSKRVLDQEEFNKKLKAKRALFSTSRSLSLASFRLPSSVGPLKKPKLPHLPLDKLGEKLHELARSEDDEDEEYLKQNAVHGELDFLTVENLINLEDVKATESKSKAKTSKENKLRKTST